MYPLGNMYRSLGTLI